MDRVTLNAGVRYDAQMLYGYDGKLAMALPHQISPRVGLIYDFTREGRSKIFASFARFYENVRADAILAPVFAHMDARHPRFVADFLAEVFRGPAAYSAERGGHAHMIGAHLGRHLTETQRRRWFDLMLSTADEVGLRALRPDLELLLGGGPEGVRGSEEHRAVVLAQLLRQLADRRRLAGAVDADDEDDMRLPRGVERQGLCHGRQDRGDLLGQRRADLAFVHLALEAPLGERARECCGVPAEAAEIARTVRARSMELLDEWSKLALAFSHTGTALQYQKEVGGAQRLLYEFLSPELKNLPPHNVKMKVRANRSMRDVEGTVNLWMKTLEGGDVEDDVA
jgi:truncated hemoglobin YjbI